MEDSLKPPVGASEFEAAGEMNSEFDLSLKPPVGGEMADSLKPPVGEFAEEAN